MQRIGLRAIFSNYAHIKKSHHHPMDNRLSIAFCSLATAGSTIDQTKMVIFCYQFRVYQVYGSFVMPYIPRAQALRWPFCRRHCRGCPHDILLGRRGPKKTFSGHTAWTDHCASSPSKRRDKASDQGPAHWTCRVSRGLASWVVNNKLVGFVRANRSSNRSKNESIIESRPSEKNENSRIRRNNVETFVNPLALLALSIHSWKFMKFPSIIEFVKWRSRAFLRKAVYDAVPRLSYFSVHIRFDAPKKWIGSKTLRIV